MGAVYAAIHPVIGTEVAIKVLHEEVCSNRKVFERFIREARAVNQIDHPGIVRIFGFGYIEEGRPYLVMERLRGVSLETYLERHEKLKVAEALRIFEAALAPLGVAHEAGIVHRDIKPENLFILEDEGSGWPVKLLDFGIAKLRNQGPEKSASLTRTGQIIGTPYYMAPEQVG